MTWTRAEQAYQSIRQGIVSGTYSPSQRLIETEIASSLGMSRISVRSALQRLHQEGLVIVEPHRGATVTAVTLADALQILELREGLEGWAAALAAQRITDEAVSELETIVVEMDRIVREGRLLEHAGLDTRLHKGLIEAAGNRRLGTLVDSLKIPVVRFYFSIILIPGRGQESVQEHAEIVSALRDRAPDRAEKAMRRHIAAIRRNLLLLQKHVPAAVQAK